MPGVPAKPVAERIRESVVIDGAGCWVWQKFTQYGYGKIAVGSWTDGSRRTVAAHRAAYETFVGPIPDGAQIDHLCRNTSCCNPEHLEAVTPGVNARRRSSAAMLGNCARGHAQVVGAQIVYRGKRYCRYCRPELAM
jgi:hypothetical protein